jgi:hypothetical protein
MISNKHDLVIFNTNTYSMRKPENIVAFIKRTQSLSLRPPLLIVSVIDINGEQ